MERYLRGADSHEQVLALIPWVVNGTATAEQVAAARAHVAQCADCRSEYDRQSRLYGVMHEEGSVVFPAEHSFQKLIARIDAAEASIEADPAAVPAPAASVPRRRPVTSGVRVVQWLAAAVIVQAVGLGFSAWLWHSRAPLYETLTQAPVEHHNDAVVRIIFAPNVTLAELQSVLHAAGAQIASGPTDTGLYTLALATHAREGEAPLAPLAARIAQLRASPDVQFVLPLPPAAPP
jgi:hypothetical protein